MLDLLLSKEAIAVIAVILTLIGYSQYIRTMVQGITTPHMFSWLIWASLTAIAFFAQISDNAGPGAWITGLSAAISFFIFFYAFFKGQRDITKSDCITFITACSAIPVWLITENPFWSVIMITIIDALGFYPTFRKSWNKPHEENLFHYFTAGLKFVLAVIAIDHYSVVTTLYPLSLVVMNFLFLTLVIIRRARLKA